MESTAVYWKPIWNLLETSSYELLLVNGQQIANARTWPSESKRCATPVGTEA
jgi:hypothetical protein